MKLKYWLFLFLLALTAFIIRVYYLPKGALVFGYDQARDAYNAKAILSGDLKVLGPPSSAPGLYHGVFYYYFISLPYFFGQGNPLITAYWLAFFNSLATFIVFFLAYLFTKKVSPAMIAAVIYAVSFEAVQYATWMSNPTIAVWTVPTIYLGLWTAISSKKNYLRKIGFLLSGLGLGLSIQAEIFLAYHLVPVVIWLTVARKKIHAKELLFLVAVFLLSISSLVLVEFKFGFKGIFGLKDLLSTGDKILSAKSLGDFVVLYLNQIGKTFSNSLFPSNIGYGGVLGMFMSYYLTKDWFAKKHLVKKEISYELFIVSYILSHASIVSFGGVSTPFLTVGIGTGVCVLAGIFIWKLWEKQPYFSAIIFGMIIVSCLATNLWLGKKGQVIFAIQEDMILSNQIAAIDYTYKMAEGSNFSINTLTSPAWVNTTWSYLFNWYGVQKYGYIPQWYGRDQIGQLGDNLPEFDASTDLHFYIKEPPQGLQERFINNEFGAENAKSILLSEKFFGEIMVEERKVKDEKD